MTFARPLVLLAALAGCDIDLGDWNFDGLDDLGGAFSSQPLHGLNGVATFNWVDGCPQGDTLFGCHADSARVAMGAELRLLPGAIDFEADEQRVFGASVRTTTPALIDVALEDHTLLVRGKGAGLARLDLIGGDGEVIDTLDVLVEPITALAFVDEGNYLLEGTPFGVRVVARGPAGDLLNARGALYMQTDALATPIDNAGGFYYASEQFTATAGAPGTTRVRVATVDDSVATTQDLHIVAPSAITGIEIAPTDPTQQQPYGNRLELQAIATVGDVVVRGGSSCEWSITEGEAGLQTFASTHDDTTVRPFPVYTELQLIGAGRVVVQCRANPRVVGERDFTLADEPSD